MTNLITSYDKFLREGRTPVTVCLAFSRVSDAVSHNAIIENLFICRLVEQTGRWIENWLNSQAKRMVSSGANSGKQLVDN